jgi:DNA-binding MarR family transcriptional regulator
LALATAKDAPTITRILGILIKKGLVDRKIATKDRRKQMLFLTEKGRTLHGQAFPIVANMRYKVWEKLSDSDFDELVRIMDTIYSNVD